MPEARLATLAAMSDVQFLDFDHRRIAYRHAAGRGPALVFLPGYMSDMEGGKATALFNHLSAQGRACLLLDYSGCGRSEGDFADGTLSRWRDEVLALIEAKLEGPVVLVGSSMGGWLMLLVGEALGERLAGTIGIASAPDFTTWGYDDAQKAKLAAGETVFEDSDYGYDPMPTHAAFWRDGETLKRLERGVAVTCPVRLLHGQADSDVPHGISLRLAGALHSEDVQVVLVKAGDHRLSRDEDITLLKRTVDQLYEDIAR